ncbi:MAG: NfeD family protein [Lachnospiraceae bacterium]|jgi:membrane protein implicated in regulation of membrane protease activity|nr:NfeD family protein [Lachnospiraceae bacterium]
MWQVWLILAGVFFILEAVTTGFLIFWLGLGAIIAAVTSFIPFVGDNVFIQTAIFVISSTILILSTKPLVNKYFDNKKSVLTNSYSLIGKKAIVIKDINSLDGTGQIKVNGEVWSAKPEIDDGTIAKGTEVEILGIDGVKTVVTPV